MIEVTNEKELLKILSLISEEAVKLSREGSNDPYVEEYMSGIGRDQDRFGINLSEQEEE